jgi:hypothetical protein
MAALPALTMAPVSAPRMVGGIASALRASASVQDLVVLAGIDATLADMLTLASRDADTASREGLRTIIERPEAGGRWLLGVVILVWPSLSVAGLPVVIGAALVVEGVGDIARRPRPNVGVATVWRP